MTDKPKALRGFAALSPEQRTEMSRRGGHAVPAEKRTYARDRNLAKVSAIMGNRARGKKHGD